MNDVLVGGDTLLVESGDLPGELLADRPGRVPLRLGRLRAKEDLVVQATYVGPSPSATLAYEVSGFEAPTSAVAGDFAGDSAFLPMCSGVSVPFSASIQSMVSVPRGYAFLPEEVVLRDPEKWIVRDVKVGHSSQFALSGDAPGAVFRLSAYGWQLNLSAVPGGGVNFVLDVKYVGPNIAGEPIFCGVVGRVVRLPVG